jgi:hypothetical protein
VGKRIIAQLAFIILVSGLVPSKIWAQTSRFGLLIRQEAIDYSKTSQPLTRLGKLLQQSSPTPSPSAEPQILGDKNTPASRKLTVAVLGDSMVDVLQPELPQLREALKKYFPETELKLYNFGVGATNLEYARYRLTNEYDYLGKRYPSVLSVKPDVLVIESFAYNNFGDSQEGLDKQWLLLAEIISQTKKLSPKTRIILAATIAPNSQVYGEGIAGIDWSAEEKKERSQTVKKYLENLIHFAQSQNYPLADAYHPSMDKNGEGKLVYINAADHLHPSGPGGQLFCRQVAETIKSLF